MNKKILTIMVILVVVLVMGASILFFNQKNKKISDANILTNIEKEIRIEAQKNCGNFYRDTKNINNIDEASLSFPWIIEEEVFLLNGNLSYFDYYDIKDSIIMEEQMDCLQEVVKKYSFKNGFSYNYENSHNKVIEAFEKDNIKISINRNYIYNIQIILFGDISRRTILEKVTQEDLGKIFKILGNNGNNVDNGFNKISPTTRALVGRSTDDFFEILMSRTRAIFKKKNNSWNFITFVGPDAPPCEPVFEENIPYPLVDSCFTDKGILFEYNKKNDSWEIAL